MIELICVALTGYYNFNRINRINRWLIDSVDNNRISILSVLECVDFYVNFVFFVGTDR